MEDENVGDIAFIPISTGLLSKAMAQMALWSALSPE